LPIFFGSYGKTNFKLPNWKISLQSNNFFINNFLIRLIL
jgi:hypothetical protein